MIRTLPVMARGEKTRWDVAGTFCSRGDMGRHHVFGGRQGSLHGSMVAHNLQQQEEIQLEIQLEIMLAQEKQRVGTWALSDVSG